MKKILFIALLALICVGTADAAVRDTNTTTRVKTVTQNNTQKRGSAALQAPERSATARTATTPTNSRDVSNREPAPVRTAVSRDTQSVRKVTPIAKTATVSNNTAARATSRTPRTATTPAKTAATTVARAAIDNASSNVISTTRTGASYEQCKNAYFTCMDQFCKLKNDDYRRCSCSDRVYDLTDVKNVIQQANDKLTVFTEGLDTVGMSSSQAAAMRNASDGENALTSDGSASKALLQAIMNSIRGEDASVGGKFTDLNTINLSFDTTNAFGTMDAGQAIAAYNGKNLYTAIYPQCRNAVRADCNDASLQRAVTAYLMAVEQDCNTVQTFIDENKKKMTAAVREGSAMLDLARVENRQQRNSDDMTTCLNNVESAILSEEVCGSKYHKCLDNGEFIDVSTGAPIAGVVKFYELEHLLTFSEGTSVADQKLSKVSNNRIFVQNFENRVKKFAQPALDKCTEKSNDVWNDYLDKAMLDIYYAQKSKVTEIKQGCFDFVSACYINGDKALTTAMKELAGSAGIILQPDKVTLNSAVCKEYVASCDNMFDGNIVQQYVDNRQETDTLSACRAVAKQCFDKFGGTGYENFYYPYSGLFTVGNAADWFALCDGKDCTSYKSECAKQLSQIDSCSSPDMMKKAFGGLDYLPSESEKVYGLMKDSKFNYRELRPSGVATEIYYQIIDILSTQCTNVQGRFVELQFIKSGMYKSDNICISQFNTAGGDYNTLASLYGVGINENMCPRDYGLSVDTQSWGACLCWENGARRSKWGKSVKCVAELPVTTQADDKTCSSTDPKFNLATSNNATDTKNWCTQAKISTGNQTCPFVTSKINPKTGQCVWSDANYEFDVENIPEGIL